jgi:formate hydrogenlyase subunit 6/NADH:ubiquinone oxidoreductase subunit I
MNKSVREELQEVMWDVKSRGMETYRAVDKILSLLNSRIEGLPKVDVYKACSECPYCDLVCPKVCPQAVPLDELKKILGGSNVR